MEYVVATIDPEIAAFASFNDATDQVSYTKVDAITMFGEHKINFKWETTMGVKISDKDKKYFISKPDCEPTHKLNIAKATALPNGLTASATSSLGANVDVT
jgi:hypothetical protein